MGKMSYLCAAFYSVRVRTQVVYAHYIVYNIEYDNEQNTILDLAHGVHGNADGFGYAGRCAETSWRFR